MKTTNSVRAAFLSFFARHGHAVLPSSSLVPQNDPTLMFANAGMNQFKNIFTGVEKAPTPPRAATAQKCVRAGGKHNDLDNVGYTARHHTFFEMLGNFSFGDYFKEEAINLAWELLTKDYGLNPEKLCVTVYHDDDFAWSHWKKITGFADHKIIRIATNDNFWAMGDTGPCGPCSEIFYDHGEGIEGGPPGSANADGDRFIEIWNLVFMQFEQVDAATRVNLPKPSIDTGMGLERLSAVLQGVHDNYDIDVFKNLITAITHEVQRSAASGQAASQAADNRPLTAHRVIADHLRSSCFLVADGVMPSNEGRGYVLRRIMRRAMRYAHQLGCKDPLMHRLVPALVTEMGEQYPELSRAQATIIETLRTEEERFKQTLERGLKLLEEAVTSSCGERSEIAGSQTSAPNSAQSLRDSQNDRLFPGDVAFKLYDTYGFPLDLTQDILRARGIGVDTAGFDTCMENQRDMARAAWSGSGEKATGKIWFELKEKLGPTTFTGYEHEKGDATVLAIVKNGESVQSACDGDTVFVVLNQTPFYGESGGQVGDKGFLFPSPQRGEGQGGGHLATITDTKKPVEDFHIHAAKLTAPLTVGDVVHAAVESPTRTATRSNHSATHLMHKALRDVLGDHVAQKGSYVGPDRLRFDFSNPKAVSAEELAEVERRVNAQIALTKPVSCNIMKPEDAIKAGAMALFGEKYGDQVRVLGIGDSVELCGGTHVANTGDIGLFKITSEGSVASGVRRIEGITGEAVRTYMQEEIAAQNAQLQALLEENATLAEETGAKAETSAALADLSPLQRAALPELPARFSGIKTALAGHIQALQEANKKLGKQLADLKKQQALSAASENVTVEALGSARFIGRIFDGLDAKELRPIAEMYLKQADATFVASNAEGKASIVIGLGKTLAAAHNAATLIQEAVGIVGGKGGGGKPEMAQGGGPDASKLPEALASIRARIGS